jgi:hypothetical protein
MGAKNKRHSTMPLRVKMKGYVYNFGSDTKTDANNFRKLSGMPLGLLVRVSTHTKVKLAVHAILPSHSTVC